MDCYYWNSVTILPIYILIVTKMCDISNSFIDHTIFPSRQGYSFLLRIETFSKCIFCANERLIIERIQSVSCI